MGVGRITEDLHVFRVLWEDMGAVQGVEGAYISSIRAHHPACLNDFHIPRQVTGQDDGCFLVCLRNGYLFV